MSASQERRQIRQSAREARSSFSSKDEASDRVVARLMDLPSYRDAGTILWYVDVRGEVRTLDAMLKQLGGANSDEGKKIVVPYCVGDDLVLFHLRDSSDLAPGAFGILEPRTELRSDPQRAVRPEELDLVIVPGVAFDERGNRLGYGKGYYDRLLSQSEDSGGRTIPAVRVALAYECQIVPRIPAQPHDVPMDWIVTESRVFECGEG